MDYFPGKFLGKIRRTFNDDDVAPKLENKLYFDFFYRQLNFSLPEIHINNFRNIFFIDNKNIEVNNVSDFKILLAEIFKKGTSSDSVIIKKA